MEKTEKIHSNKSAGLPRESSQAGHNTAQLQGSLAVTGVPLGAAQIMQLQRTMGNQAAARLVKPGTPSAEAVQRKENNDTGMPDGLKSGLENLSGMDLSDVRVHHNSAKPAGVGALAYAQGNDIHVAPGQEKHLPHEGWHVVQQRQGRVRPTMQTQSGAYVNDDSGLEKEADRMGTKAMQLSSMKADSYGHDDSPTPGPAGGSPSSLIQRQIFYEHHVSQFSIDGKKPSFMGALKQLALQGGQSKDHIIPYAAIENDLAVFLNEILAKKYTVNDLTQLTEALFLDKTKLMYHEMVKRRTKLIADLNNGLHPSYEKSARALLSALNSSEDNVRIGDSITNSSIGENIDANFLPGTFKVGAAGLNVQGAGGPMMLAANTEYLRLEPNSEEIVYNYQDRTSQGLSFVLGAISNTQLSSETAPQSVVGGSPVSGLPVIVFGKNPLSIPFYYA
ncbi:DUF4157 domain-containing protein [Paenibacillus harenae]|uniref:eCIS core domain-containing protein n=1 Tax=Paenibacillus harenae TaxID=306543 RepID=UPI00040D39DD|nr:DUF4157 domain-containing protein [Paenibacillus harenae]